VVAGIKGAQGIELITISIKMRTCVKLTGHLHPASESDRV